jgi:hypothetical protein
MTCRSGSLLAESPCSDGGSIAVEIPDRAMPSTRLSVPELDLESSSVMATLFGVMDTLFDVTRRTGAMREVDAVARR